MSDFGGFGFAAGQVRGIRSFKIDRLGRLTGVSVNDVWRPEENKARCARDEMNKTYIATGPGGGWITTGPPAVSFEKEPAVANQHDPTRCSCGFYAYFDGLGNPYHDDEEAALAVVEGYGKTVLGEKGFRAQKARIVALVLPSVPESRIETSVKPPPRLPRFKGYAASLVGAAFAMVVSLGSNDWWLAILGAVAFCLNVASGLFVRRSRRESGDTPERIKAKVRAQLSIQISTSSVGSRSPAPEDLATRRERVRANYPDIPIFESQAAMLAAFPVDAPVVTNLSPETDPDFWTRKASS